MTHHAHFDPAGGLAGDMVLAALVDAGRKLKLDVESVIHAAIDSADIGCKVTFVQDSRASLACLRTIVDGGDVRMSVEEIQAAFVRGAANDRIASSAQRSLQAILEAETTVHQTSDVHLHEVGAADTVVDLLGAAAALDYLEVTSITCGPVPLPHGWVRSGHGPIPLPAPAVVEMLAGATVIGSDEDSELVTPTGVAILRGHNVRFQPTCTMRLLATGVGGGTRERERPNICRVLIGQSTTLDASLETVVVLEANIDDQTPEALGFAITELLEAGAKDAWVTPIVMKKSRPAFALNVIVSMTDEPTVVETLFRTTSSIGVRRRVSERWVLHRRHVTVTLDCGQSVRVKIASMSGRDVTIAAEFEDCATVARSTGLSLQDLLAEATVKARQGISPSD